MLSGLNRKISCMKCHSKSPLVGAPNGTTRELRNPSYLHHADRFWSLYLDEVDPEDVHLVESWKGDTDGILIFTGLFAATVATFVAQTYQLLIPSSDDISVAIQLQVSQQIAGLSNGTSIPAYTPAPFEAPFYAVWVNTLWFLSLFLSLTGALVATMMQQWTRRYLRGIRFRSAPHIRGAMHVRLRLGIKKYKMKQAVTLITSLLHAAVFIFFAGLVGFAFSFNSTVANVLTAFVSMLVAAYIFLSILPIFSTVTPYDTVLTPALQGFRRLGPILLASAFELSQRTSRAIRSLFCYLARAKAQSSRVNVEGAEGQHFQSREQELMRTVRQDDYSPVPHFNYVLGRILTNASEHHEIQEFLDSMDILLSSDHSASLSLVFNDRAREALVQLDLSKKICLLLESCFLPNLNGVSLSTRIKRLRTVVVSLRHYAIQRLFWTTDPIDPSPYSRFLRYVAEHPKSSMAFPSQLITICSYREEIAHGEIRRYSLTDTQAIAHGWYGSGTDSVEGPLFCLVELVCTILKFAMSEGVDSPVAAYQTLWESILGRVQDFAAYYMRKSLYESDVIVEPIPRALLIAAGLEDPEHQFYSPPARRPPTTEEQVKIKTTFSRYPKLADALRDVAATVPLIPLYGPLPRPSLESGFPAVRRRPATASIPTSADVGWVSFGPLTWHNQPAKEYQDLMRAWLSGNHYFDTIDDACEVLKDDLRGVGYARICFEKKDYARQFVNEWTESRPRAYRNVTAEILDDDENGRDGDGARDGVGAGEEDDSDEA